MRPLLLLSALAAASAAPAIVWSSASQQTVHSSESLQAADLISSVQPADDALAVVFVVGRDSKDGTESLGKLASGGKLPGVQSKYDTAAAIHHHVGGVESARKMAEHARDAELVDLKDFDLHEKSGVVVVEAHAKDAKSLDAAVAKALASEKVSSVVLAAQRSVDEVKAERALTRRLNKSAKKRGRVNLSNRRRLEDQEEEAEEEAEDESEVAYYVSMTPNILAGIMFTFFFIVVSHLGLHCMGMISNSDTFATKYPAVGREA